MEQSDVLSQINLNYVSSSRQSGLRHFRQQAVARNKELKKQQSEKCLQKQNVPTQQVQQNNQQQIQTKYENNPIQSENNFLSYLPIQTPYQETNVTSRIIKIIDNNKKLLNLKALKWKSSGIYNAERNTQQRCNNKLKSSQRQRNLKVQKMEDIQIEPNEGNSELYLKGYINKPKLYFEFQGKEEEYAEKQNYQKNLIEFLNCQIDILKIKNHSDLHEVRNIFGQNNLFLLEQKLLIINMQQLLTQLLFDDGQNITKKHKENIHNMLNRIPQQMSELENIQIDNEVALKNLEGSNLELIQKQLSQDINDFNKNNINGELDSDLNYQELQTKHKQQLLDKIRQIEKLKFNEILNKKQIQQLKSKSEEQDEYLKNIAENKENSESLKLNVKKILEMHKQIKQLEEESMITSKKNKLLNNQLSLLKSENKSLNQSVSSKINSIQMKLSEYKLDQNPIIKIIKGNNNQIQLLRNQKDLLDQLMEQNKQEYQSKHLSQLMQLEQKKKLIEAQSFKSNQIKQENNFTSFEAVQQLSNIVLSKQTNQIIAEKEFSIQTQMKDEFKQEIQKLKDEHENQIRNKNEQIEEKEKKVLELNEKVQQYLNIAFFLNDILIEISDLDDYKAIRQKLDNNREQIVKFYGLTSVDFIHQSPDIHAKRKCKFDYLGKGYVESFDVRQSPFIDEQFSRISQESDFKQNIIDLKKRSESNLLSDLHILENMGAQSMHEYMHMRLSKIMQENCELKDENQRYKQVLESIGIDRKSNNEFTQFKETPDRNQIRNNFSYKQSNESLQYKLDDIPDNQLYALFMQAITIEEMLKQAEEVQLITNEIEKNQDEQQRLLQQSLEFQYKQLQNSQEFQNQQQQQQQQQLLYQENKQLNQIQVDQQQQQQSNKLQSYLRHSVIQEQSGEEDDLNETPKNLNSYKQQPYEQYNYQINYTQITKSINDNQFTSQ